MHSSCSTKFLREFSAVIPSIASAMKRSLGNILSSLSYSTCSLNALECGDVLKQARIFSMSDINEYSKLTHDHNPLHFDMECATRAGFNNVPVPGMLVASLFPRIIASHFAGAVYVKQSLEFKAPVFVGDEIIGQVEAINIRQVKQRFMVKFVTNCFKNGDTIAVGGKNSHETIVLNSLCKEGELEKAVDLMTLMLHRGFWPHFGTSNELLVSLCEVRKANDAAELLYGLMEIDLSLTRLHGVG